MPAVQEMVKVVQQIQQTVQVLHLVQLHQQEEVLVNNTKLFLDNQVEAAMAAQAVVLMVAAVLQTVHQET